jgi:Reverse transcriptase (RNA-dependent DNA polymerase)
VAEVAILPKIGKKDKSSIQSWRPIALLSCISKDLERITARRIAWIALTRGILSPQHGGTLPKCSAMGLVAAFTHDVESAMATGSQVTMITMDVQGAFGALLVNRLLARTTK